MRSHNHTIVCLEDDHDLARLIVLSLRSWPTTIYIAHDGVHGLNLIRQHHPDLILLDLGLPGMNGWDVCAVLAGDPMLAHIPVVILTAVPPGPQDACFDQVVGYMVKPFTPMSLREQLQPFLPVNSGAPL